jgi:hypothetical protein
MSYILGVNLLPSTGEFTYDTIPYLGQRVTESTLTSINRYANGGPNAGTGTVTDYSIAIDNLQAQFPGCTTVSLVVSWFGNSTDVTACQVYPSTTYINGGFQQASGASDVWRCSGLTQSSSGLIPIPQSGGAFIYGGTPSDQSLVRCIGDLKSRGLRVVFYPFALMTPSGEPWRGRITYNGTDVSSAATTAINNFLGPAATSQFTRDTINLTVAYGGSATDYTYRRMILHYANLCVIAGGVDLFLLGSEFRGLEIIRGSAWTKGGHHRQRRQGDVGLSVRHWPYSARRRRAQRVRQRGPHQGHGEPAQSDCLFGRLVGVDGLSAPGRERTMAASRPASRPRQYRHCLFR